MNNIPEIDVVSRDSFDDNHHMDDTTTSRPRKKGHGEQEDSGFCGVLKLWVDNCDFGPLGSNKAEYFSYPKILTYILVHTANFFMALHVLFVVEVPSENKTLYLWLGLWMLSTQLVLWGMQFDGIISQAGVLVAMLHNHTELAAGLYSIQALKMEKRLDIVLLLLAALFASQSQVLFNLPTKKQIALTIVAGDLMHYIAIVCFAVATFTNDTFDAWWLLVAAISHHLYDIINYPGMPNVPQYYAHVCNTITIALVFTYFHVTSDNAAFYW